MGPPPLLWAGAPPVALAAMCGIIAVLKRPSSRPAPLPDSVLRRLQTVLDRLASERVERDENTLLEVAAELESIDRELKGTAGVACLLAEPGLAIGDAVEAKATAIKAVLVTIEARLDAGAASLSPGDLERINAVLVRLNDAVWAIGQDRVRTARGIAELAATSCPARPALEAFWAIEVALSSLDRLEVRGRDSAGLHVLVTDHRMDLASPEIRALMGARATDSLFGSLAVRTPKGI